jgi:hypothetical protein
MALDQADLDQPTSDPASDAAAAEEAAMSEPNATASGAAASGNQSATVAEGANIAEVNMPTEGANTTGSAGAAAVADATAGNTQTWCGHAHRLHCAAQKLAGPGACLECIGGHKAELMAAGCGFFEDGRAFCEGIPCEEVIPAKCAVEKAKGEAACHACTEQYAGCTEEQARAYCGLASSMLD